MIFENTLKRGHAAAVAALNSCAAALCLTEGAFHHLVRNGRGEKYHQIRRAYFSPYLAFHLGEYLCLAAVFLAGLDISAVHTIVSAYYNNAHSKPSNQLYTTNYMA